MNIKTAPLALSPRAQLNPIRHLSPPTLSRILEAFSNGNLAPAAQTFEAIERRDDVLQGVIAKRKKAVARLEWDILTLEDSPEAHAHREALEYFYNHLTTSHACDQHVQGTFPLLVKQMMDATAKKYAVHEIIFEPTQVNGQPRLTANFRFVPLWYFKHQQGKLHFLPKENSDAATPLKPHQWLVTSGEGLMESCSIAYLFKHLPLKDWLIYCERNGMPGVKGTTNALPNSPEWNAARDAVQDFGAEFCALMSEGTNIEPIDLSTQSTLPYPQLIERMDRAMIALWRGADLSTLSKENSNGASLQHEETSLLLEDDAATLTETLNTQIDAFVLKTLFGTDHAKAYFRLQAKNTTRAQRDINLYKELHNMGLDIPEQHLRERFGIPHVSQPQPSE